MHAGRHHLLRALGLDEDALLGAGNEARVYALDGDRVLRIPHGEVGQHELVDRQRLMAELISPGALVGLSEILDVGERGGLTYSIERRLPGRTLTEALQRIDGPPRARLIEAALDAAAALGDLPLRKRGWYGELLGAHPNRAATWHGYLRERAAWSLDHSIPALRAIDPDALAADLPETDEPAFVHLDVFADNLLTSDGKITAVLDVGATSLSGDRRFDPIATAIYLTTPLTNPALRPGDEEVVRAWLTAANLLELFEPVRRWLAAFWAFALDDPPLLDWCGSVLLRDGDSRLA